VVEAPNPDQFDSAFAAMTKEHAAALLVLTDSMFVGQRRRVVELAARSKLPALYSQKEFVDDGGLISYGPSLVDMYRRAATHVDKVLRGAKPADLPIEQPTKFELVINLKTAKALGLTIPQSLLLRADEVIQSSPSGVLDKCAPLQMVILDHLPFERLASVGESSLKQINTAEPTVQKSALRIEFDSLTNDPLGFRVKARVQAARAQGTVRSHA